MEEMLAQTEGNWLVAWCSTASIERRARKHLKDTQTAPDGAAL